MEADLPSIELLHKLLRYDPESGQLFWRPRDASMFSGGANGGIDAEASRWNARFADRPALICERGGYLRGKVMQKTLTAHRVIWAMQTGKWPKNEIDHINGVRGDNTWGNLREATSRENNWNRMNRANKTGFTGVRLDKRTGKYFGRISYEVGPFDTPEKAATAYMEAKRIICGKFAPELR